MQSSSPLTALAQRYGISPHSLFITDVNNLRHLAVIFNPDNRDKYLYEHSFIQKKEMNF